MSQLIIILENCFMLFDARSLPTQRSHPSSLPKKWGFSLKEAKFHFSPLALGDATLMITLLSLCWCRTCHGRAVETPGTPTAASPTTPWATPPTSPAPSPSSGSTSTACLHQVSHPHRGHHACSPGLWPCPLAPFLGQPWQEGVRAGHRPGWAWAWSVLCSCRSDG